MNGHEEKTFVRLDDTGSGALRYTNIRQVCVAETFNGDGSRNIGLYSQAIQGAESLINGSQIVVFTPSQGVEVKRTLINALQTQKLILHVIGWDSLEKVKACAACISPQERVQESGFTFEKRNGFEQLQEALISIHLKVDWILDNRDKELVSYGDPLDAQKSYILSGDVETEGLFIQEPYLSNGKFVNSPKLMQDGLFVTGGDNYLTGAMLCKDMQNGIERLLE